MQHQLCFFIIMHCASIEMLQPKSPISASLLLEYTIPTPTLLTAGVTHSPKIQKLGQADLMRVEKYFKTTFLRAGEQQFSSFLGVHFQLLMMNNEHDNESEDGVNITLKMMMPSKLLKSVDSREPCNSLSLQPNFPP